MAQSAVVARPRPEDQQGQGRQQQQQQQLFAPLGKPPLSPQLDSSLITSSVRKRKGEWACGRAGSEVGLPCSQPHPAGLACSRLQATRG